MVPLGPKLVFPGTKCSKCAPTFVASILIFVGIFLIKKLPSKYFFQYCNRTSVKYPDNNYLQNSSQLKHYIVNTALAVFNSSNIILLFLGELLAPLKRVYFKHWLPLSQY